MSASRGGQTGPGYGRLMARVLLTLMVVLAAFVLMALAGS